MSEVQEAVTEILKQNREILIRQGTVGQYRISGNYNGQSYVLGINDGRIGQFYSPLK